MIDNIKLNTAIILFVKGKYGDNFMSLPKTSSNILNNLGLRLTQCRKKKYGNDRGSLKQCAEALGTSPQNWNDYEAGRREIGFGKVLYLANFFSVDPIWLLTGQQESMIKKSAPETGAGSELPQGFQELMEGAGALNMAIQAFLVEAARGTIPVSHVSKMYKTMMETVQSYNRLGLAEGSPDTKQA